MKKNPVRELKKKIVALEAMQRSLIAEREDFREILNRIQEIFNPLNSTYQNRVPFRDMPAKILELLLWRKSVEGAIRPDREQIEAQREIIRWLIKPSSADNSRELKEMKKMRGF